jgi:hypothetical protein
MSNCYSDVSYVAGEGIRAAATGSVALAKQVASALIAIDNANRLVDNYRDQRDIAQRAQDIAEAQQQQLETVFWPREAAFLAEFSTPEPIESVEVMGARYAGRLIAPLAAAFAKELRALRCAARRHCTSANQKQLQDILLARGVAMANARVIGRNIGFAEFQARTDINLSRRMQAVSMGRGLINDAMTLLRAAGAGYAGAGQELSQQFNSSFTRFQYERQASIEQRNSLNRPSPDSLFYAPGTVANSGVPYSNNALAGPYRDPAVLQREPISAHDASDRMTKPEDLKVDVDWPNFNINIGE